MGHTNKNDDYWKRASADWDLLIEKKISDLHWEIDQSFMGSSLDYGTDVMSDDFGEVFDFETEIYQDEAGIGHKRETARLEGMGLGALDSQFRSDCIYFAQWIEDHRELPEITRLSVPQYLRELNIAHTDALNGLQAYIEQIEKAKKASKGVEDQYYYHMALHDLWQGMWYLQRVLRIWRRKNREAGSGMQCAS